MEDLCKARDELANSTPLCFNEIPPHFVPPRHLFWEKLRSMDEALKLLGSFARFVQQERPELEQELGSLALKWAEKNNIPRKKIIDAILDAK